MGRRRGRDRRAAAALRGRGRGGRHGPARPRRRGAAAVPAQGRLGLELRLGLGARATRDLDAAFRGPLRDAAAALASATREEWSGFSARVGEPERIDVPGLDPPPLRIDVKLAYRGKPFATVPFEVAAAEGRSGERPDLVTVALELGPVGLEAPEDVPCLSVPYQMAQKLHACTHPGDGERPNDRARDLADLILLEDLLGPDELGAVRAACEEIFAGRARHPWPPQLVVLPHWEVLWAAAVDGTPVGHSLAQAAEHVEGLIARIDAAR